MMSLNNMQLNKIYNVDCMQYMATMDDNSVDFLLTDIPYGEVNKYAYKGIADVITFKLDHFLKEAYRVTKGSILIFCGRSQFSAICSFFNSKSGVSRIIVWDKPDPNPTTIHNCYASNVEFAIWFQCHGAVFNSDGAGTVFSFPVFSPLRPYVRSVRTIAHKTQKPVELFRALILDNTLPGAVVFDPCIGSGTTAIACKLTGRNFIGCELDKDYYAMALDSLKKF